MIRYYISHATNYSYSDPVPVCHNQVHLAPRSLPYQTCADFRLVIDPIPNNRNRRRDYFGNPVDYFTMQNPHHGLNVTASSTIELHPRESVPRSGGPTCGSVLASLKTGRSADELAAYQFSFPSHFVPLSPKYAVYAMSSFSSDRSIVEASIELTARINEDFVFDPRATTISTPVDEVFHKRAGVCQDFAHFQIACLRSIGIAARYVSGYLRTTPPPGQERLVGADASHAWLSVYCGELGWIDFDPTNNVVPATDHITVAWGRDYKDVCPIQGVFLGGGYHSMSIAVNVASEV